MNYVFPTSPLLQITQAWGRVNFSLYPGPTGRHMGVDLGGPVGSPIYAACDGIVCVASGVNEHGYGRYVIIQHDGFKTLYAHLHQIFVQAGVEVTGGELVGGMGGQPGDDDPVDGASSGSHLHFEVILPSQPSGDCVKTWAGYTVDPLAYLTRAALGDPSYQITVVTSAGVRVRSEARAGAPQIGALSYKSTYPANYFLNMGTDQWARLWSLRPEFAAVVYAGGTLMTVEGGGGTTPPVDPPPALDEIAIRKDEIDRMMAYLQLRKNEL